MRRSSAGRAPPSRTCAALPDDTINFQHDALACAVALGWADGVEVQTLPLVPVREGGALRLRVDDAGRPTPVVTRVDGRAFSAMWRRMVAG